MITLSKVCAAQVVGNFSQCSPCGILVNPRHVSADVNEYGEEEGPSTTFAERDLSDSFSRCKDLRLKLHLCLIFIKFVIQMLLARNISEVIHMRKY